MNPEPIPNFNINPDSNNGSQTESYQTNGYEGGQSISGAGNNSWQTDPFSDSYQENIFEQNFGDTPGLESAANSNPLVRSYSKAFDDPPKTKRTFSAPELEL